MSYYKSAYEQACEAIRNAYCAKDAAATATPDRTAAWAMREKALHHGAERTAVRYAADIRAGRLSRVGPEDGSGRVHGVPTSGDGRTLCGRSTHTLFPCDAAPERACAWCQHIEHVALAVLTASEGS